MSERVKISNWTGGKNQWKGPTDLDKNEALECRNQEYRQAGVLQKRKGCYRFDCQADSEIKGIHQFLYNDKYYYLVISEDKIYSFDIDSETLTELESGFTNKKWSFGKTNDCPIIMTNGLDRARLFDGEIRDCGVFNYPTFVMNILAGEGGNSEFRVRISWYDEVNNYESRLSNESNTVNGTTGKPELTVNLSELPTASSRFTHYRIYRTLSNGNAYFFAKQVEITKTSTILTEDDKALRELAPIVGPMPVKPYICFGLGRMWCGGREEYSEGTVEIANGQTLVHGAGTTWNDTMVGKYLVVSGRYKYVIQTVNVNKQIIRIRPSFRESTCTGQSYKIISDEGKINFCDKLPTGKPLVEQWPYFTEVRYSGNNKMTGLMGSPESVAVFNENGIHFILPTKEGYIVKEGDGCLAGASSHHAIAKDGRGSFYYLSANNLGIWKYSPGNVREEKNMNIGLKIKDDLYNLTRSDFENAIAVYYDEKYKIWIGDSCFVYDVNMDSWSTGEGIIPTAICKAKIDNKELTLFGDDYGFIYKSDTGTNDGANLLNSAERSGTATSGGNATLTDSGKSWGTDKCKGLWVNIVSGTGEGQRRKVLSNTSTRLTVTENWNTNPDSTSKYAIGAIRYWRRPGWIVFRNPTRFWRLYIHQKSQSSGEIRIKVYKDYDTDTAEVEGEIDLTKTIGHIGVPERADALTFDIKQEDVDVEIEIYAFLIEMALIIRNIQERGEIPQEEE